VASKKKSGKNPAPRNNPKKKAASTPKAKTATPSKKIVKKTTPVILKAAPKKTTRPESKPPRQVEVKVGSGLRDVKAPPVIVVPKNGKNAAGLSVKELAYFRELLLAKRRELVGDVSSMEDEVLRSSGQSNLSTLPIHMADMGTDNYEQEFTLGLVEKDRNLLRDIQAALGKINAGTYGICEGTGKPISKPRLEAQPWARYSIEHARTLEQRRMRA